MIVLHYIPSIDITSGGLGSYMQITTPELGKLVELHVATHNTPDELSLKNCTLHYISGTGINVNKAIREEVWNLIEEIHPDIIHVNCCWTPLCAYFTLWTKEFCQRKCIHIPIVYTPHGMLEPWIIAHNYWTRKVPATLIYQRRAFKCADIIHSTAESEQNNLRKLGWNKHITIIPNCVNVEEIDIKKTWEKTKNILYLSRIHPKKGINFLIEAVAQLKNELSDYTIRIVGTGEERYINSLISLVDKYDLQNIIKFEGAIFGDTKYDFYRKADLFLLPTHSENFGIVVAEALASGTPVITTIGTPWQELESNNCGWCTEIGTKPLVNALKEFLQKNEQELETMGRNGRQLIETHYSCKTIARQFANLYSQMVNRPLTILHYIPRIDKRSGGLGSYMQLLSEELGQHCKLHILTHYHDDNLELKNCTISYLSSMWPTPYVKHEFHKILDATRPDIVHINTCWLPLSAYTVMWAKEYGYKVVLTPHGMLDTLIIRHNYWTRKMPAILYYQRKAVETADLIHSTSKREQRILSFIGWNRNIRIIPNGVNIDKINHNKTAHHDKTILYLGRIHPQKGLIHLIEAVAKLKKDIAKHGYTVKLVGMGETSYTNKIRNKIKEYELQKIVFTHDAVFEKVKWELLQEASLLVLPSYSESFGLVVAEALACGTPVITTQGTPWEEIAGKKNSETNTIEGRCGWWIERGTQPLTDALQDFLNTSESAIAAMGENGKKLIADNYSCKKVGSEFLKTYKEMKQWKRE